MHPRALPVTGQTAPERGDAARNRALLLTAARTLLRANGPDAVTMDDIAAAAGVGKGTLFRRFGSRAGLMIELLDEYERELQHAFLFGPPPLGPGAPPVDRLIAYGRARLEFVRSHQALLADAERDPVTRYAPPAMLRRAHVRVLLADAATTGDLDAQAEALVALLDPVYVDHETAVRGRTLDDLAAGWETVVRKVCGH